MLMSSFRTFELSNPADLPPGIHFVTVKSAALKRRADITFYIPPQAASQTRSLPLVTLLHGVYGSHWAWVFKGAAHRVLNRLIQEQVVPPMMLAMPSDGLWGDGSGYLHHTHADHGRWIVEEVPAAAALVEPKSGDGPRFIAGLSMGGYGALRLGALHPHLYAGISAHSSITDVSQMQGFVEELPDQYELPETHPLNVLECIKANADRLPPLRFDCGTEDQLIEPNKKLHNDLVQFGIPHVYEEYPGAHTWDYWHEHLADTLRFFAKQL